MTAVKLFLSDWDFALVRFKPAGTAYTSFGSGGKVTTAVGSYYYISGGLGIQSGGKIVVAGAASKRFGLDYDFAVERCMP